MFAEPLAVFFNPSEFGDAATLDGATVNGIFDDAFSDPYPDVVGSEPQFTCASVDVPDDVVGKTLVVRGVSWTVRPPVRPDGQGVTVLKLEKQ